MYSSLSTARSNDGNLYCGWTKHRADATMAAVRGPVTPVDVKNSAMFGVKRNGTGRLASKSPGNKNMVLLFITGIRSTATYSIIHMFINVY